MTGSPRSRITAGLVAIGTGRLVLIAYNFLVVPIFLSAWGIRLYGEWVVLTAFASFAALSNIGFVQASASEMIMRVSAGDREEARRIFSTTMAAVGVLVAVVVVVEAVVLSAIDAHSIFGTEIISPTQARLIVGITIAGVLMNFFLSTPSAAISGVIGTAIPSAVITITKLFEIVTIFVLVRVGMGPVPISLVPIGSGLLGLAIYWVIMRRAVPWLRFSFTDIRRGTFFMLLHPSLAQFALFISANILVVQLPRIVLAHLAGAAAVAVFSVSMTYSRAGRMLSGMVGQSLQVELSRAFSEKNSSLLEVLVERGARLNLWAAFFMMFILVAAAPYVFAVWTHGRIPADMPLITVMVVVSMVGSFGDAFQYFLTGINRVTLLAAAHVTSALMGVLAGALLFSSFGVSSVAAGLGLPELAASTVGIVVAANIFGRSAFTILRRTLQPPFDFLLLEATKIMTWRRGISRPLKKDDS